MKNSFILATTLFVLSSLTGCSTSQTQTDKLTPMLEKMELTLGEETDRILNYRIRDWKYVDSKHIILEANRKEFYLLTLRSPCPSLSSALEIGFTSSGSVLSKFERIIISEPLGMKEQCSIKEITKLVPPESKSTDDTTP